MDLTQTDHLKSYGIAYWVLSKGGTVDWLLNYRGGSFMLDYSNEIAAECRIRGVSFESVDGGTSAQIYAEVQAEGNNMDVQKLEKLPKIAVYVPPGFQPWDDAVTLAMQYAEIKYDKIWDEEVVADKLKEYDWLHLHHEDFTGQYGKFIAGGFGNAPWYIQQVALLESTSKKLGFKKVSDLKKAVAEKIRSFVSEGGFMFAMCSATDTYDIALAAHGTDIVESLFDGDGADPAANEKLDYTRTFAFQDFKVEMNPYVYEYSNIDVGPTGLENPASDYFTLFDFSAKFDPVPTMLTQCHVNVVHGFLGQTTAFHRNITKKSVVALAEREGTDEVKYIHGNVGRGTFTWYGGHDPEDYQHAVGDPATDLSLHKNSPGYRLILNNVLFPAAKKKKQKT
ncbi:MAG: asparagine synthetase B [Bacteroidota bacterium]